MSAVRLTTEELLQRAQRPSLTDEMALAVARELAAFAQARGLREEAILPRMDDWDVHPRVAAAAAIAAQEHGVARLATPREQLLVEAARAMRKAREATAILMREGLIPEPPVSPVPPA